ncbi:MAG TPA: 50S ribosomal protein L23 [Candidatus Acidoferrum sp.]|nr:50S ribosomal protein L23 [Candidatus Acidoferrum sp.]
MKALHTIIVPRLTDKSYALSKKNAYVFKVPIGANKNEVAQAVAKQYNVAVEDVNIVVSKGKVKTAVHNGRPSPAKHSNFKKAYVTLAKGNSIKMFEEEEQK